MPQTVPVPAYIGKNAELGLKYHKEGRSGQGIKPRTIREARDMVEGSISEDKVRRMGAWFARHQVDLKAPKNSDPEAPGYPGPGLVAWLLWGGDSDGSMRAAEWAQRTAAKLDEDSAQLTSSGLKMEKTEVAVEAIAAAPEMEITIEARAAAAEAKVAELIKVSAAADSLLAEAKAEVVAAFAARDEAVASAAKFEALLAEANERLAALEKATAPAAAQAAVIVASCSADPANVTPAVTEAPAAEAPKSAYEKWLSLSGKERTDFFAKNKSAIQAQHNAKR